MPINDILKQFADLLNTTPSIEDGNVEGPQGDVYTSEVSPIFVVDGYQYRNYRFPITFSEVQLSNGNKSNVCLKVQYNLELFPGATVPGRYGSDLIHENNPFLIASVDQDYVHGIILEVQDITYQTIGTTYVIEYTLLCSIEDGDPDLIEPGHILGINTQLYTYAENNKENTPVINLRSSINKKTGEVFFYWDDVLENVKRYRIMLRHADHSFVPDNFFLDVFGKNVNSTIDVLPFIVGGTIKTMKILDPGIGLITNRSFDIIGKGIGEAWATNLWEDGSLLINEFLIYDVDTVTGEIYCMSQETKGHLSWPLPAVNSYVSGLLPFGSSTDYGIFSVVTLGSDRYFKIKVYDATTGAVVIPDTVWKTQMISNKIQTHDGVYKLKTGSGYDNKTQVSLKVLPEGIDAYMDPVIHGNPPGIITEWTGGGDAFKGETTYYNVTVINTTLSMLSDLQVNIKTNADGSILSIEPIQWDKNIFAADTMLINAGWDNKDATAITFKFVGATWGQSVKLWGWRASSYIGDGINKKITTEWSEEKIIEF